VAGDVDTGFGPTLLRRGGIARLNSAGSLLASFDGDGKLSFNLPGRSETSVEDMIIQPGGLIVVAGHSRSDNGLHDFFIARFTNEGKLDTSFGGNGTGFALTDLGGDDLVGGMTASPTGGFVVSGSSGGFAAVKYTDNGLVDTTFGVGGKVHLPGFGGVANIAKGPGRRLTLAGGGSFATARLLESGANVVAIGALGFNVGEGLNNGTLIVARVERLPVPTRVFIGISGTARGSGLSRSLDYTFDNLVQPLPTFGSPDTRPYVDIPAFQTNVFVTMTIINDTLVEGTETATFTILPDPSYEIGTPGSGEIDIADDDGITTNLAVADDSYVRDGTSASKSFGSATDLQVKTGGAGNNRVSYLKFDLSSVGVLNIAKLSVFGKLSDAQNTNVVVNLFSVADTSWTGSTLTFNNKPAPGATPLASVTVTDTALREYVFDVSSYVKQEKALGHHFVSFMLKSAAATNSLLSFNSGNATGLQPKLAVVTPATVGVFTATSPPHTARVAQDMHVAVTWTVPLGGWRQLTSIELLLRDLGDKDSSALLKFDEHTNSFSLLGASGVLASGVGLVLEECTFAASGPTSPTVTVTFAFHFNAAAAGHRFALAVSAENDAGSTSDFSRIGTIHVRRVHGRVHGHGHHAHRGSES
jgi:uncharacterized delta-60 repeat protein